MSASRSAAGIAAGRLSTAEYAANFSDVHPPLDRHEARVESDRCYFCFDAPCQKACPTSIDIPHYVMDQIREYLAEHRELKFKHMVLLGLTKLGIKVEPEDLKPERRRGVS